VLRRLMTAALTRGLAEGLILSTSSGGGHE